MSDFDSHEWGVANGLFHCTREPHEVLGHCHDHRCDELRTQLATLRAELERKEEALRMIATYGASVDVDVATIARRALEQGAPTKEG